jgi:hypothetical protein
MDALFAALILPMLTAAEPSDPSPVVYALRTLMKLQASYSGKTFAQLQADFKTQWNSDYPSQPIP